MFVNNKNVDTIIEWFCQYDNKSTGNLTVSICTGNLTFSDWMAIKWKTCTSKVERYKTWSWSHHICRSGLQ